MTGLPSQPMQFVGDLLESSRIKLDWILPFDTRQGGGNNARFAVFFHFFSSFFFPLSLTDSQSGKQRLPDVGACHLAAFALESQITYMDGR